MKSIEIIQNDRFWPLMGGFLMGFMAFFGMYFCIKNNVNSGTEIIHYKTNSGMKDIIFKTSNGVGVVNETLDSIKYDEYNYKVIIK